MTLDEKRATRPKTPENDKELLTWINWHNNHDNIYAWDFDFLFMYNGHIVKNSSLSGNGSGSYTFNREKAKDYILSDSDNVDLLREALKEFCVEGDTIAGKFLSEDCEYFDVTIRCYILSGSINSVLEDMRK